MAMSGDLFGDIAADAAGHQADLSDQGIAVAESA